MRDKSFDKPIMRDKSFDKPIMRDKNFDKPIMRDKSFDKPIMRDKSFDKPIMRDKSFDKPIMRDKSFDKLVMRDKKGGTRNAYYFQIRKNKKLTKNLKKNAFLNACISNNGDIFKLIKKERATTASLWTTIDGISTVIENHFASIYKKAV